MVLFSKIKHLLIRDREPGKGIKVIKGTHASALYRYVGLFMPFCGRYHEA